MHRQPLPETTKAVNWASNWALKPSRPSSSRPVLYKLTEPCMELHHPDRQIPTEASPKALWPRLFCPCDPTGTALLPKPSQKLHPSVVPALCLAEDLTTTEQAGVIDSLVAQSRHNNIPVEQHSPIKNLDPLPGAKVAVVVGRPFKELGSIVQAETIDQPCSTSAVGVNRFQNHLWNSKTFP